MHLAHKLNTTHNSMKWCTRDEQKKNKQNNWTRDMPIDCWINWQVKPPGSLVSTLESSMATFL